MKHTFLVPLALVALWTLLAVSLVGVTGCNLFDGDDVTNSSPAGSRLNVYGTDDPGDIQEFWVRLLEVTLYDTDGEAFPLVPIGESDTIDLVAAAANAPEFMRQFELPPGTYDAISGGLELDRLVVEDDQNQPQTCTSIAGLGTAVTIPQPVTIRGASITVDEDDEIDVVIDIPLVTGDCDPSSGVAIVQFGAVQISRLQ